MLFENTFTGITITSKERDNFIWVYPNVHGMRSQSFIKRNRRQYTNDSEVLKERMFEVKYKFGKKKGIFQDWASGKKVGLPLLIENQNINIIKIKRC